MWYHTLFNAKFIFIQIVSFISNNLVQYKYTVELSKTFLFQAIQFSQTILIQTIQFSISIDFLHTQLNVKTVQFQTIPFSISRVSMLKTVLFQAIQLGIGIQFNC